MLSPDKWKLADRELHRCPGARRGHDYFPEKKRERKSDTRAPAPVIKLIRLASPLAAALSALSWSPRVVDNSLAIRSCGSTSLSSE